MKRVVALIPAKQKSERIKNKNLKKMVNARYYGGH